MYHTFFFFERLSKRLNQILPEARLLECFSQQKDELIFRFFTSDSVDFFIKADLAQGSCLLTFPSDFGRTRSNSVDLFSEVLGSPVTEVIQSENDRSFHIRFANGLQLCFKMYGNRSNVILHDGQQVKSVFNNHLKKDLESNIPKGRPKPEDSPVYSPDPEVLRSLYPTFSKRLWKYWEDSSKTTALSLQESLFLDLLKGLKNNNLYICKEESEVFLSFFPIGEVIEENSDPISISNRLSQLFWQVNRFFKQKQTLVLALEQKIFETKRQMEVTEAQWLEGQESRSFRLQADLLMAFGHLVPKGDQKIELPDFSGEKTIEIKLKKELSVIENAERFYRKAKGQQQDMDRLEKRAELWKANFEELKSQLNLLQLAEKWPELKPFISQSKTEAIAETETLPYHLRQFMDYEIWIGKNAKSNDEMLRLTHKDDIWLHARDTPGSHVIIKNKKGKTTPKPVLERAAQWAAFYSKAKNDSLCPVMVTERKYVRKIKNTPAGQVRVEKEKTILVEPLE
jgi:predicted ribosome quality control (RQC) complex YloA/Tae2 family protein